MLRKIFFTGANFLSSVLHLATVVFFLYGEVAQHSQLCAFSRHIVHCGASLFSRCFVRENFKEMIYIYFGGLFYKSFLINCMYHVWRFGYLFCIIVLGDAKLLLGEADDKYIQRFFSEETLNFASNQFTSCIAHVSMVIRQCDAVATSVLCE